MDASCFVDYTISLLIPSQHNNNKVRNIVLDGTLLHVSAFGSHHQANTLNVFSNPPSYQTGHNTRKWRSPSNKNQIILHNTPNGPPNISANSYAYTS
jgi:hypothetical protein